MNRHPSPLLALALAFASLGPGRAARPEAPATGGIPWRTDLEAARREARESGKPLLVVFR